MSASPQAVPSGTLPRANSAIQMPRFELDGELTREQVDWFETFGFIRFRGFKPKAEVASLVAEVEQIDAKLMAEGRTHVNGVPMIIGKRNDGTKYVQRMVFASLFGDRLHQFLGDPRLQAIVRFAGPGYRIGERERDGLVVNHFRREEGTAYSRLGWHTDSLRDVAYFERPRRYLNVGFYLDDSPIEKGGVRLLPCTHRQSILTLLTHKWHFMEHEADESEYAVVAEAGDLTIHDGRLWHRVAHATASGEASRRRVMYVPMMEGPVKLKHEGSRTPFYFRLKKLAKF